MTLTNTGTVPLDQVEYMRNVDPDQEEPWTSNFTTSNYVALQPGVGGNVNQALVVAKGLTYGITLGLGTIDARAVVSTGGFSNRDPDAILSNPATTCTEASPCVEDQAISLVYQLGSLAPGQSVSFDYAYILNEADLAVALGQLAAVSILQPVGTVSGTGVLFQATTDDVADTTQMEFFVNGTSIGIDTTPDAGGVFATTFDSTAYPNGTLTLKAVASFSNGTSVEKTATVNVDNSGPPVAFSTPTAGAAFSGSGIPIAITVLDPLQPPVEVSFFRETASTGSVFLGSDTTDPFEETFSVTDLAPGETVVIKAVARDALSRTTTIQVSGSSSNSECGNGTVDAGEQCDDGNTNDGDCCSATCQFESAGSSCSDANACTTVDVCDGVGQCVGSAPVVCAPSDQCHDAGVCDSGTGLCSDPPAPSGQPCDDGNACTADDQCDGAGTCAGGGPVVCAAPDDCHDAGVCNPASGCSNPPKPSGSPCTDDGNGCTADQCDGAGSCAHSLVVESPTCGDCDDGIDNDASGERDGDDTQCSTLAPLRRFAALGTEAAPGRSAVRLGRGTLIDTDAATPVLADSCGPETGGVCGQGIRVRGEADIAGTLAVGSSVRFVRRSTAR